MFSELAKNDLIALRQQGFEPTDEDVVKLNDLALRIERGKHTTPANAPRVAFAGNVVLHEPTIGAIKWWHDFGRESAQSDDTRLLTYFFMLAHSTKLDVLEKLEQPEEIQNAISEWAKKVNATEDELWRALMYVKYGLEDKTSMRKEVEAKMNDEETMNSIWVQLVAAAGALHLAIEDFKMQTYSEMIATLVHARMFSQSPLKVSVAEDYIAYRQILKQIEDRGKKETEAQQNG